MFRKIGVTITVVILSCLLVEMSIRTGFLLSLENSYYDLWHQVVGERRQAGHTAIIAIDDESLGAYQNEPLAFWGPHFARAIETLRKSGVAMIGVDFIFDVDTGSFLNTLELADTEKSRMHNAPLLEQLMQGQVILAGLLAENDQKVSVLKTSLDEYVMLLPEQSADVGLVNLLPDRDNIVRHFAPSFYPDNTVPGLSFATLLAVRAAELDPQNWTWKFPNAEVLKTDTAHPIAFAGPPGSIPRLSFLKLLGPNALENPDVQNLQGKVVILAVESTGTQDLHFTPYASTFPGKKRLLMNGAEIHANIVETLLSGRFPHPFPFWGRIFALLTVMTLASILFFSLTPLKGLAIGLLLGLFGIFPAYIFFLSDWIVPLANIQMGIGISYLAALGFRLTGEERQRARLHKLFGQFVSDDVVNHLVASGATPRLGGEACQVTVLFSDIRNFTTISEILTPTEVVEMLNAYFSRVSEPILEQGGMINKFIGDAVMAVFGAPAFFPDHSERALRAALGMKQAAEEFRHWMEERFPDEDLPDFCIGIGLHSGDAVLGNIGSTKRMEYTAIGDTVNIASRLESASKDLQWTIVASSDTIDAAKNILTGKYDTIQVKGRKQAVKVFEILGLKTGPLV